MILLVLGCSQPFLGLTEGPTPIVDTGSSSTPTDSDSEPNPGDSDSEFIPHESDTTPPGDSDSEPHESVIDLDYDNDGFDNDVDCDDDNDEIYPGADEIWYDGVDQDCANDNDYDQDQDGVELGTDCNDINSAVYPGAIDTWYDGVDSDCAGDDDFDQDDDGQQALIGGGEDCDDTDPTVNLDAMETLGDAVDQDCDGGVDSAEMDTLDTSSAAGLEGPRIGESDGYVIVTFIADDLVISGAATTTGAVMHQLDVSNLPGGSVGSIAWSWGSTYVFDDGLDFWANDDWWVFAYGLHYNSARYLVADTFSQLSGGWAPTVIDEYTSQDFDDIEMALDADGSLHLVGCDDGAGVMTWMHGLPEELFLSHAVGDEITGASSDACAVDVDAQQILAGNATDGMMYLYNYSNSTGLSSAGSEGGWTPYDTEVLVSAPHMAQAVAEGARGVYVSLDGAEETLPATDAQQVDIALDPSGQLYVGVIDGGTDARVYYGAPGSFTSITLNPGLGRADDIAVFVASTNVLVVAVRGGNDLVYMAVNL